MRSIAFLSLGGLATAAAAIAVFGVGVTVYSGSPADVATVEKGDRLPRTVQVACGSETMVDTATGCADIARALAPPDSGTFQTTAITGGQTTILVRKRVSE
ncbi:hypothetical protein [Stappia sp. ES.058]|uniref:hypothetical protein n=1 Tax=Stappia sp. ES.058 TaxID=1881061 RepID=UPI00087B8F74|nr:hypothetical protein [Stappia sp. ES.058]SDU07565.1 hypothetical protein SAMN05428979_1486 [Stappia sp. ES.058]